MKRGLYSTLLLLLVPWRSQGQVGQPGAAPGQVPVDVGFQYPDGPIKNTIQGSYSGNITLYFMNSPYRVSGDVTVEQGATMTIETGVKMFFDSGVGLIIKGTLRAIGNQFAHIQMLPYQQQFLYDYDMPKFRMIDGPSVAKGRLQVLFRDRWRSVCTKVSNWTVTDLNTACRSMGFSEGIFWKWYRRNNDTYPFVMPKPDCHPHAKNLWDCPAFANENAIPLSENLCQGEDDLGLWCLGQPTFQGWSRHWKGVQIYNSPFKYVNSDPDHVSVHRESRSRLEFVDILYAGYDKITKNVTSALIIEGVPPIMNGLRIERSAENAMKLHNCNGPALIANSTFSFNRGHGIQVEDTYDGRVFVNHSRIDGNWGDGIWYKQKMTTDLIKHGIREKRDIGWHPEEAPRIQMCSNHSVSREAFFPHLVSVHVHNGTIWDPTAPSPCWMIVSLPTRLPYTYSIQWLYLRNKNEHDKTWLIVCDTVPEETDKCRDLRMRIPILDGVFPQSVAFKSSGKPLYLALEHEVENMEPGRVKGDIQLLFKIHASVLDKAYYGLNVTNCIIDKNIGNGISAYDIRDRTTVTNVTLTSNQGIAGFYVKDGAADIWLNETRIFDNWGDGMNVSYAGGSVMVNGTSIRRNRWRGAAFHFNQTIPFLPMYQEVIFKGRPANNIFYLPTIVGENLWGGILVGNFCTVAPMMNTEPKVLITWVEMLGNIYHPALEIFSCQHDYSRRTVVDVTGNRIDGNFGFGMRIAPLVNMQAVISSNQFLNNNDTALYVRNAQWPQLWTRPANATISKNSFKFNQAQYIVSIGLNEDAPEQSLVFNQQNEIRNNKVFNPFPDLPPRDTPYAALVVSSSNVKLHRNCFKNEHAEYEIATELQQHAKWIDARENNWGTPVVGQFINRIFDQFNRYSLASIDIDPFMAVCNQRVPHITPQNGVFRQFRKSSDDMRIGGIIYENYDLEKGRYTVTEDLQVVPGAKLTVASGSVFEFGHGIGMIVQGEFIRNEYGDDEKVVFTSAPFELVKKPNVRLVNDDGNDGVTEGRLELFIDGEWGTVCNRSWTPQLTILACNQLGLIADVQFFENWRIFPSKGDLPMIADNIRCEENEVDITKCRNDGVSRNAAAGCDPIAVVGLRCLEPRWAGVRYSLLANPPTVTGQTSMDNWVIEKGGLFNFRTSQFCPALQIDWNYHTFHRLVVKNNFWDGIDIVYNDLIKKPTLYKSSMTNNRRNGLKIRSAGITVENVTISQSGLSGVHYNPSVSSLHQKDIVSWLDLREQPDQFANNIIHIPNAKINFFEVVESALNQRKFLVASMNEACPEEPTEECVYEATLHASGHEYGLASKLAIQIVNPASNISDEDAVFTDTVTGKTWSARKDQIFFPAVSSSSEMKMRYKRSYGVPKLVILVLYLDTQEYVDRFVHVYNSRIEDNQYGFSAVHYNNLTFSDGTLSNRWNDEKLWLQKVNFTRNSQAVMWLYSPQFQLTPNSPIAEITYHLDNCSIHDNTGPIVEFHKDQYASANIFHWIIWSNTFANNTDSGFSLALPDTYDLISKKQHSFWLTENRFEGNSGFRILLDGYYTFANISSNNFTENIAPLNKGMLELSGMEKLLYCERNRFHDNWGHWMVRIDSSSQYLKEMVVPSYVQYNYITENNYIKPRGEYVDMWPRSYAVGVFGSQKVDVHYNRLHNVLMDFELVSGCRYGQFNDVMNVTYNWWGTGNDAVISQRIFDFDDWNTYMLAMYSPYYMTNDLFVNFWWNPLKDGQVATSTYQEPSIFDLHGRVYENKNMTLITERWYDFPHYYRPYRPYRITRDVTIMPGATLRIESGVELHIFPYVRILVLGDLIADGTYWQPIRFKPINVTEVLEEEGKIPTEYRKKRSVTLEQFREKEDPTIHKKYYERKARKKRADRSRPDEVYQQFPVMFREDQYYQRFTSSFAKDGAYGNRGGFLQIYNATSGEIIPSCDRQFTVRNAQVVCRELGYETQNAYQWVTARWDYHPELRIVKSYMEPRECRGDESRLDRCNLRLTGNNTEWQCLGPDHFNYVYCGSSNPLQDIYIGNWGGIAFSHGLLELNSEPYQDASLLRNVEIVGGGNGHREVFQSAGLQLFQRSPMVDHVNVTNSSLHGVQIISPREKVILSHLNVTDNKGKGLDILTTMLQSPISSQEALHKPLNIPYNTQGMLDMCSATKAMEIVNRILIYYKYDSYPIDCAKVFTSSGRKVSFRFVQINLYHNEADLGRPDALKIYGSDDFTQRNLLADFRARKDISTPWITSVSSETLALHVRATAADGIYGFIAEISAVPSIPEPYSTAEVVISNSRIDNNDRGAIDYCNTGEVSPTLVIEDNSFAYNGFHLFGNISTSNQAVQLNLHNTMFLLFRSNSLAYNIGGLYLTASSSSPVVRLQALIKNCLFSHNSNSTSVVLRGNNNQMVTMLNNIISYNYALYFDTVLVHDVSLNMTNCTVFENLGLHTVNMLSNTRINSDTSSFVNNHFYDNRALGCGHQYLQMFGYQPYQDEPGILRRPKRQAFVIDQKGVSFDWWTHVDNETTRYRSTIVAGNPNVVFHSNVFNNPKNMFEITTAQQSPYDTSIIDAKLNYWGFPGTVGVAAGKIRDKADYNYLTSVDYLPVLESNVSLLEGGCPPGWFQAGYREFQSCFLYIPASVTYQHAVQYCESLDAFVPYMRTDDVRQAELARRIDQSSTGLVTDMEKISAYGVQTDMHVWIASVNIPSTQCGWLSARTSHIGLVNCNALLPFVCEKGTQPYTEPIMWRTSIVIAVIIVAVLVLLLVLLLICWFMKSRQRRSELAERKSIARASLKLQKKQADYDRRRAKTAHTHESAHASLSATMLSNLSYSKKYTSPTETIRTSVSDSSEAYTTIKSSFTTRTPYTTTGSLSTQPNPYSTTTRSATTVKETDVTLNTTGDSSISCSTCTSERSSTTDCSTCTDVTESTIQPAPRRSQYERRAPHNTSRPSSDFSSNNRKFKPLPTTEPYRSFVELTPPNAQPRKNTLKPVIETSM